MVSGVTEWPCLLIPVFRGSPKTQSHTLASSESRMLFARWRSVSATSFMDDTNDSIVLDSVNPARKPDRRSEYLSHVAIVKKEQAHRQNFPIDCVVV